jgi:outer membrane protein assembly factor BamA
MPGSFGKRERVRRLLLGAGLLLFGAMSWPDAAKASIDRGAMHGDRFVLETASLPDSILSAAAEEPARAARDRLWARLELEALAARVRDRLALSGALEAAIRLTLDPGEGSSPGRAWLRVEREVAPVGGDLGASAPPPAPRRAAMRATIRVEGDSADARPYQEAFDRAAREVSGASFEPLAAVAAGVAAVRDRLLEAGRYAGGVSVDSVVPAATAWTVHLRLRPGAPVSLESLDLEGARTTRPNAAAAIAGLRRGDLLRPEKLEAARERLQSSELFTTVGAPRVGPGSAPDRARIVIPVEEARTSRFEGVLGAVQGGGVTGAVDLALENIAGTGRAAGLRWTGLGPAGMEYAVRYREPALFGKPFDAAGSLDARMVDSLFTRTRWMIGLGARAGTRGRVAVSFARGGTTYGGVARGTTSDWAASLGASWRALTPASNPRRGVAFTASGEAGRRRESLPGLPTETRALGRGTFQAEGAVPRGEASALYASARVEGTSLGGETFPAEELRYVGGNEGLRGHRERAFGGSRVAAFTLEHRWLTDRAGSGGRAYLFADAAWHELGRPLGAGVAAPGSASQALARTELSDGWDFGYGAGLRARVAAGMVGVELGLRPGASLGAATLHLRYGSRW